MVVLRGNCGICWGDVGKQPREKGLFCRETGRKLGRNEEKRSAEETGKTQKQKSGFWNAISRLCLVTISRLTFADEKDERGEFRAMLCEESTDYR